VKLYELVGVKKFADLDFKEVLATMQDYKEAGEGANAIVVKHGTRNEVIKFWLEDVAYEDFINYVDNHPSKYFPKLYSKPKELTAFFLRPKEFPKKVKYVRMEELEKFKEPFAGFLKLITDLFYSVKHEEDVKDFNEFMEMFGFKYVRLEEDLIKAVYGLVTGISVKHFVDIGRSK
jgi:hypothetical protein